MDDTLTPVEAASVGTPAPVEPVAPVPPPVPPPTPVVASVPALGSLLVSGDVSLLVDYEGLKIVNGLTYHDIHCTDGTTYLLSEDEYTQQHKA